MQLRNDDFGECTSLVEQEDARATARLPLGVRRSAPPRRPRICAVLLFLPVVAVGLLLCLLFVQLDVAHGDDTDNTDFDWYGVTRLRDGFFQLSDDIAGGHPARTSQRHDRLRHPHDTAASAKSAAWEAHEDLNCWVGTGSIGHPCCDNAGKAVADLKACKASCLRVRGCNCVTHKEGLCWLRHNCTFKECVEADGFTSARTTAGIHADLPIPLVVQAAQKGAISTASGGPNNHTVHPHDDGAQNCHTATEGERCYEHVIWAMTVGFKREPSRYKGLSTNSTRDDFQVVLHDDPDKGCPRPCSSALAILERSANAIAEHALRASAQHPPTDYGGRLHTTEPYESSQPSSSTTEPTETSQPTLTTTELVEEALSTTGEPVESSLAVAGPGDEGTTSTTSASTEAAQPRGGVTLFCWSVFLAGGNEIDLLTSQRDRKASIFACEGYLVFLNDPDGTFSVSDPNVVRLDTTPVPKGEPWKGHTTDSWLNTETFMMAWNSLLKDGRFRKETWVVKVDPDCVFFPQRLATVLLSHAGSELEKSFLLNCYRIYGDNDGRPAKLFGSLEVLSTVAMEAFLDGLERCKTELPWTGWGEDYFMQSCLETVGAKGIEEFDMMRDKSCKKVEDPCGDGGKVAFHHFKEWEEYEGCLEESERAAKAYVEAHSGAGAEAGE